MKTPDSQLNPLYVLERDENLLSVDIVKRKAKEFYCTCSGDEFLGDIYTFDYNCKYHNWLDEHDATIRDQVFWKSVMG